MRMDPRRLLLVACLLVCPAAALAQPAPPPLPPDPPANGGAVLKDRVVAVVDEDPILASEVDRAIVLGLAQRNPGEGDTAFRRRVLNGLVADRLRLHEIDRFGLAQVPVDEIEKGVAAIRERFPDDEAFRKALRQVGLSLSALRQLVARQLIVLTYVDELLGPRIFLTPEEIERYHRTELTREMQRQGAAVPPLDDVREQIRDVLRQRKLNQELERWTEELRREADVSIYPEPADRPLPPVVHRIEKKP